MTNAKSFKIAKSFAALGAMASAMLAAAPAQAVVVTMPIDGDAIRALTINVDRGLTLGTFAVGSTAGTLTVSATQNTTATPTGGVSVPRTGRAAQSAVIRLSGEPGYDVVVAALVPSVQMTCSACATQTPITFAPLDTIPNSRTVNLPAVTIAPALPGDYTYYIGGTASMAASQPSGTYRGNLDITADYL